MEEVNTDSLVLSKISDIMHALFSTYKEALMPFFDHLLPHFVKLMVCLFLFAQCLHACVGGGEADGGFAVGHLHLRRRDRVRRREFDQVSARVHGADGERARLRGAGGAAGFGVWFWRDGHVRLERLRTSMRRYSFFAFAPN